MKRAGVVVALCLAASVGSAAEKPKKAVAGPAPPAPAGLRLAKTQLAAIKARSIGPAVMGGRVSDDRARPPGPVHVLRGPRHRRPHEDHQQRRHVHGRLRQGSRSPPIGAVAVAPSDPKVVWVGTGEAQRPQQLGLGQRRLPLDRRRRDLDATSGSRRAAPSRASWCTRPIPPPPGWRRWATSGARRRARPLQDDRRAARPGRPCSGRGRALRRDRVGCGDVVLDPAEPERALRHALRAPAHALVVHVRARRHGRQGPGRHLQEHGRRRHLAEAREGAARRGPAASASTVFAQGPAHRLRDRAERRRRPRAASTRCAAARAASSAPRTAARPGRARARSTRGPSTSARSGSTPRTTSGSTCSASRCTSRDDGGTHLPRGPLRQGAPRLPRAGHRPAPPQAPAAGHRRRRLPELRRAARPGSTSTASRPASSTASTST